MYVCVNETESVCGGYYTYIDGRHHDFMTESGKAHGSLPYWTVRQVAFQLDRKKGAICTPKLYSTLALEASTALITGKQRRQCRVNQSRLI